MKSWLLTKLFTAGVIVGSILQVTPSTAQSNRKIYSCIEKNGVPMTVVDTVRGRIELIVWKSDYFRRAVDKDGNPWTPRRRCVEVSSRFQKFSDAKRLKYLTTGKMNNLPVICVAQSVAGKGYSCIGDSLLITLQKGENPNEVLQSLFSTAKGVGSVSPMSRGKQVIRIEDYIEGYFDNNSNSESSTSTEINNPSTSANEIPSEIKQEEPASDDCPPLFCD